MKDNLKSCIVYIRDFIVAIVVIISVLFMATLFYGLIPNSSIEENSYESISYILEEGVLPISHSVEVIDNFTDRIMIQMAITDRVIDEKSEEFDISEYDRFQQVFASSGYPRYWHGYLIVLKPALILFDIHQIRQFVSLTVLTLFCVTVIYIGTKISKASAIALAMSLSAVGFSSVLFNMQFANMFILTFVSIIATIFILHRKVSFRFIAMLFTVIGGLTSYVDFLTTPLMTLAFPLLIFILNSYNNYEYKDNVKIPFKLLILSLLWSLSYGIIWFSKWIVSSFVLNKNVVADGLNSILYRSSDSVQYSRLDALSMNLDKVYLLTPAVILGFTSLLIGLSFAAIKLYKSKDSFIKNYIVIMVSVLFVAFMPVLWITLASNHSAIHYWFTYRILSITVYSCLIATILTVSFLFRFTKYSKFDRIKLL